MDIDKLKKIKHIKELVAKGRAFEAQELYGQELFSLAVPNQRKIDPDYVELNKKLKNRADIKFFSKEFIEVLKSVGIAFAISPFAIVTAMSINTDQDIKNDELRYASNLSNAEISYSKDAKSVLDSNISGIAIPLKIMDAMWKSGIKYGYDFKYNDTALKNLNIDIYENEEGVCRHLAADLAKRLNAVDENFGAISIPCYVVPSYLNSSAEYRTIIESNETVITEEAEPSKIDDAITNFVGNHAIVLFKLGDYIMYADPTNPNIGIVKNGACYQYHDGEWLKTNEIKYISSKAFAGNEYYSKLVEYAAKSFTTEVTDELGESISIRRQNEILELIKELDVTYTTANTSEKTR